MRVEEQSEELKNALNELLENTPFQSINEIVKRAKEFKSMEELKEYINDNGDSLDHIKGFVWEIAIESVSPQFIDDNFEEILDNYTEFENLSIFDLQGFLSDLSEEMKLKKSETIINWALNSEDPQLIKERISMIFLIILNLPVKLDNPENYKIILDKLIEVGKNEENNEISSIIQQNIIRGLPDSVVKQNYKDIIEKLNTINKSFLGENYYIELIQKIFEPNDDFEMENEELLKIFEYVYEKSKEIFPNSNNRMMGELIKVLPTEFVETNIEYILTKIGEKISEEISSQFLGKLSVESILKYKDRLKFTVSLDKIEYCQKYLEYILTKTVNDIINDEFALDIIHLVDSLPDNGTTDYEKIKNTLKDARNKITYPDMEKYNKYIPENYSEELEEMNSDDFDSFIKALENIKIVDGAIPEKYCDYIIKQKLNKNSNLNQNIDKYLTILKISFQDKVKYMLEREGIYGYKVEFFEDDGEGTLGFQNAFKKVIGFLEDNLINLDESNTHIINTAFHEVRHAVQAKNYTTTEFEILNGELYDMIKEEIIREDDRLFYHINYSRMFCEIDARCAGAKGQAEYLKYLGIPDDKVIEVSGEKSITLKELYFYKQEKESINQEFGVNKVSHNGEIISISQKAGELIRKNPDWLKKYPVLGLEFNENGERKSTKELLEAAIRVQDKNVKDIYRKMFEAEMKIDLKDVSNTLEYIVELLKSDGKNQESTEEFVSLIIKNEVMRTLKVSDNESEEFKNSILLLERIQTENPDLEISKYIEEKLNVFFEKKEIVMESKRDSVLIRTVIDTIFLRKIETMNDFDKMIEDIKKLTDEETIFKFYIRLNLKYFFEKQLKKGSTLDLVSMFEKSLELLDKYEIRELMSDFLKLMSSDMISEKIQEVLNVVYNKCGDIDFRLLMNVRNKMEPTVFKQNEDCICDAFKRLSKTRRITVFKISTKCK